MDLYELNQKRKCRDSGQMNSRGTLIGYFLDGKEDDVSDMKNRDNDLQVDGSLTSQERCTDRLQWSVERH